MLLVDLLEDVLEAAIVLLQDGVLGAHVQGQPLSSASLKEAWAKPAMDSSVLYWVWATPPPLEVVDLDLLGLAALGGEDHLEVARARDDAVLGTVLVTEGVTADDDGLLPARDEAGNAGNDNGLAEDGTTAADVLADGAVFCRDEPHYTG